MFKFVDVKLNATGDKILFSDGYEKVATEDEKLWFNNRKLKAVVKDGEYKIVRFVDLHRHSGYSLLDGCIKIDDMVKYTDFCGAITDHGNMYGALKFYKAMNKAGKLPIVGEEFYCETINGEKKGNHLILLAKNDIGYKNLIKLSSLSFKNIYKKPHISYEMIEKYHEGLICTSACLAGEIPQLMINGKQGSIGDELEKIILWFKKVFNDDFYLEIQNHGIREELTVNPWIIRLAHKYGVKLVATTDAHYTKREDEEVHDVILCISTKKQLSDPNRLRFAGTGYHIHTADEVDELFKDIPEAIDNTLEIMEKCSDMKIETGKHYLPDFPLPDGYTDEFKYLSDVAKAGFVELYKDKFTPKDGDSDETIQKKKSLKKEYWDRWKFEMDVIKNMGFAGYFLIVWDFLKFAKDNGIPVGAGRGSGAGSLVLDCLHITGLDPIKYGLLFERFLNPDRISLPDIDSDLSEQKRQMVIDYVTDKYGRDNVSQIITFGTMAAKSAIRDTAKVLGVSARDAVKIGKLIPNRAGISLSEAINESIELSNLVSGDPLYNKIYNIALRIEGLPRQVGTHACGVIIAQKPISEFCPTAMVIDEDTGEKVVTSQYDGPECEEVGLVKFDFLGLRTLDVVESGLKQINPYLSKPMTSDDIPINDPKVYKFLSEGNTEGVFQFESSGMTNLLKKMFKDVKITDTSEQGDEYFERLIAAVSLYRPGPMDEIPNYLKAMDSGVIKYDHPLLENILGSTYGVLVYQEQIMFAVRVLAGFTAGQSDTVRKAMGKKKLDIMNEYGEYFIYGSSKYDKAHPDDKKRIKGCIKNGIPEDTAKKIWDKMVKFASYAFNKSHATCYAALGAKTAWLACYYPVEYMTGILNSYINNNEKLGVYVSSCRQKQIRLYSPDINISEVGFKTIDNLAGNDKYKKGIIFGLSGISGVGNVAAREIVEERENNGPFKSVEDFLVRMSEHKLNKNTLESLILTGAFDCFGKTRASYKAAFNNMLLMLKNIKKSHKEQMSLFTELDEPEYEVIIPDVPEMDNITKSSYEEEYLGCFITHPLDEYSNKLESWKKKGAYTEIGDFVNNMVRKNISGPIPSRFAGIVKEKEFSLTKTGKEMIRFVLDNSKNKIKCVAFGNEAIYFNTLISDNSVIYVSGKTKIDDFGPGCIVDKIYVFRDDDKNK